mgnify:CR=1 FL=1|jgi:methionyl-tRNA formyltransferase
MENKILFLGDKESPLLEWLLSIGEFVIQTSEKITPKFVHSNSVNFIVSYGYRHIIKKDVLEIFPNRAINLHISYLPFNRGGDPNFWSFIENSPKGVTIHYLDEGIDTGNIIVQEQVNFDTKHETLASSYEILQLTIQNLFKKNWQTIKTATCFNQKQVGIGSSHKVKEKNDLNYLLTNGWETPLYVLEDYNGDK